jgi:hypothetical protein
MDSIHPDCTRAGGPPLGDSVLNLVALPGSEVRVNWVKS